MRELLVPENLIWSCWKNSTPHSPTSLSPTLGRPRAPLFWLRPKATPQSSGKYLPRGAWKFPCSTGAELEVPDAAVVTSYPVDKVGSVAKTERESMCREWVGRKGLELPEPVFPLSQPSLSLPLPPAQTHPSFFLHHSPLAVSQPHLTSFLAARSQGPRAGAAQGPNTAGSVNVSHSCQGWRKEPHTARLLTPLALGTSPEPRVGPQ